MARGATARGANSDGGRQVMWRYHKKPVGSHRAAWECSLRPIFILLLATALPAALLCSHPAEAKGTRRSLISLRSWPWGAPGDVEVEVARSLEVKGDVCGDNCTAPPPESATDPEPEPTPVPGPPSGSDLFCAEPSSDCAFFLEGHEGETPTLVIPRPVRRKAWQSKRKIVLGGPIIASLRGSALEVERSKHGVSFSLCPLVKGTEEAGSGEAEDEEEEGEDAEEESLEKEGDKSDKDEQGNEEKGVEEEGKEISNAGRGPQEEEKQVLLHRKAFGLVKNMVFFRPRYVFASRTALLPELTGGAYVRLMVASATVNVYGKPLKLKRKKEDSYFPIASRCVLFRAVLEQPSAPVGPAHRPI